MKVDGSAQRCPYVSARAAHQEVSAGEVVHELYEAGHVLERHQERAQKVAMRSQVARPWRDDVHPVAVDCRVDKHSRSADYADAGHMGGVVERTAQLGVRLGLGATPVPSAQGVQQDAIAGDAPELFEQLAAFGIVVVGRLCDLD